MPRIISLICQSWSVLVSLGQSRSVFWFGIFFHKLQALIWYALIFFISTQHKNPEKSLYISEKDLNYNSIQIVKVYLSSATYDEIEKEMKVRIENNHTQ